VKSTLVEINRNTIRKNPLAGRLVRSPVAVDTIAGEFLFEYEDPVFHCGHCSRYMNVSNLLRSQVSSEKSWLCPHCNHDAGSIRYEVLLDVELNTAFQKRCNSVTWQEPQQPPHFKLRRKDGRTELLLNGVPLKNVQRIRLDMNAKDQTPILNLWLALDSIEIDTPVQINNCGQPDRTEESAVACRCDACQQWWAENIPGYFYCRRCKQTKLTGADGPYGGVCEPCFDSAAHDAR